MKLSLKSLIISIMTLLGFHFGMTAPLMAIVAPVDVMLTKTVDVTQAETGDTVTYTLTVTCKAGGPDDCFSLRVTDTLPEGLTVESVEAPGDYNCQNTATTVQCDRTQTLFRGNSDVITVKAKVNEAVDDETFLENMAEVEAIGSSENTPADNSASIQFEVVTCGNDQLAFSEDCDDGNSSNGDCCSSQCTFDPDNTPCDEGNPLTRGRCDGSGFCEVEGLTLGEAIANSCQLHPNAPQSTHFWIMGLPLIFFFIRRLNLRK